MCSHRPRDARRSGTSVLVRTTVVTCILLVINRVLAVSLCRALLPARIDIPKVQAMVSMLAMIGLLLPEWWLLDWSTSRLKALFRWMEAAERHVDR